MKFSNLLYTAILLLVSSPAYTQVEQWDTYITRFDGKPGSVLVDMGLYQSAPDKKYPNVVITGPQANKCGDQGMSDAEEIEELENMLSASGNFITGVTPRILAGTFTNNCKRLNYYYVKDTVGIRNALARMYARSYKNYNYFITIKHDPEWLTYRTFLYPDEATQNWMANSKLVKKLIEEGDSLKKPRNVYFDFYFSSDAERSSFAASELVKGYQQVQLTESKKQRAYGIVLSKQTPVTMDDINRITAELKVDTKKFSGTYAGWRSMREKEAKK